MRAARNAELITIATLVALTAMLGSHLPTALPMGHLVLFASALLLLQSLVRDVVILLLQRRAPRSGTVRRARCMCLESTFGAAGVLAGLLVSLTAVRTAAELTSLTWTVVVAAVLLAGFAMREHILTWWPLRVKRDPDHLNIIVTLRH